MNFGISNASQGDLEKGTKSKCFLFGTFLLHSPARIYIALLMAIHLSIYLLLCIHIYYLFYIFLLKYFILFQDVDVGGTPQALGGNIQVPGHSRLRKKGYFYEYKEVNKTITAWPF